MTWNRVNRYRKKKMHEETHKTVTKIIDVCVWMVFQCHAEEILRHTLGCSQNISQCCRNNCETSERYFASLWPLNENCGVKTTCVNAGTNNVGYQRLKARDCSVGIANRYLLDNPGIERRWSREFFSRTHTTRPALGVHPVSYNMGTEYSPGLKRPGLDAVPQTPSSANVKERYTSTPILSTGNMNVLPKS
jgi:hypothetical protein